MLLRHNLVRLLLSALPLIAMLCHAQRGVFFTAEEFLRYAFHGSTTNSNQTTETHKTDWETKSYWFTPESRTTAEKIVNHTLPLKITYYQHGNTTAWILDEIGKELPITVGIVITDSKISLLQVLEYREVRGGEVRYDFFTKQFVQVGLAQEKLELDKNIDGISGATFSVRALKKTATLALFLNKQIIDN
jgi:FMN-binding domain